MYIDFTGGTKTMSAAAALAGSIIGVQMVYVGTSNYLIDFRKPEPGSEELFFIDNPMEIFGDLELEKVYTLIEKYNYPAAAEKLQFLKEQIPDPLSRQRLNFIYLLVKVYEHWDALEFPQSRKMMERLLFELKRDHRIYKTTVLMESMDKLEKQYTALGYLDQISILTQKKQNPEVLKNLDMISTLMFTMYANALRRERQEKYDMATLLLYRLLEMVQQRRLILYNIYVSKPEYMEINYDKADKAFSAVQKKEQFSLLKSRYLAIKRSLFPNTEKDFLPTQIALLEGYIILAALGDRLFEKSSAGAVNMLKRIRSMVSLRNNSIFAHGLGPVSYGDYMKFRSFVEVLFQSFCTCEGIDFEEGKENAQFCNPIPKEQEEDDGELV